MSEKNILLNQCWLEHLAPEFDQPYMLELFSFLLTEQEHHKTIFPAPDNIFAALNSTDLQNVKVVVLGQDPYHGPMQAHGLSFSVPKGVPIPPSLKNIYKEIVTDIGVPMPAHGNLAAWAAQGVLLLNSVLTVEQGQAGSHQGKGWERFTDVLIDLVNDRCQNVVFLLWGAYAQKKGAGIDSVRHQVLQAAHPSPLSAYRGFLGCGHFSQANEYLQRVGKTPIDWQIN